MTGDIQKELLSAHLELAGMRDEIERLKRDNEQLRALGPMLAHEIAGPLRGITLFGEFIVQKYAAEFSADALRDLRHILRAANRLRQLTHDLLAYARAGEITVRKTEIDIAALIANVIESLHCELPDHRAEFRVGSLPNCQADVVLLRQVFMNLLRNAIKFSRSREQPVISIDAVLSENTIVYRVSDNGIGFDMQGAGRLFAPFQRLHATDEYEGSGVGLAIVKEIIQRHGGRVWAEGRISHGATISFTLT
jgi:light-regulated signal transduction histidine kinase (bacteriophytochrome)